MADAPIFELFRIRFRLRALQPIVFPVGKPANVLRGGFGTVFRQIACTPECTDSKTCAHRQSCPYARIFEPGNPDGPSGFNDLPRPFVFRARHLDGCTLRSGEFFQFDVHLFDIRDPPLDYFRRAFAQLACSGIGPTRGTAELLAMDLLDETGGPANGSISLPLSPIENAPRLIRVFFLTPTELKVDNRIAPQPDFAVLFGRIRDRISILSANYGRSPLPLDYAEIGQRAESVRMTRCEIRTVTLERHSSRTQITHPLGGFVGVAEYEGELGEFLPFLLAARWVGVGRQTVWGKGEIRIE